MVGENPIEILGADCTCPVLNQLADRGSSVVGLLALILDHLRFGHDYHSRALGQVTAL
jgi:hypothetical protein